MAVNFKYIDNNSAMLSFKQMPKLDFKVEKSKGYVKYGKDNLYPNQIVRLYNEHPEHRAIINRKARYVWGKGLKAVNKADELKVNAFIDSFNKFETLNEVGKKISNNTEIFNGVYIEVITNLMGVPIEFYFLNSANCRISEDKNTLYFSKNWKGGYMNHEDIKEISRYQKNGKAGTFFVDFKYYSTTSDYLSSIYPTPQYQSVVDDINTDIDISTFNSNYVANGFSVGKMIVFFNGNPTPEMQSNIDRRFKGKYAGEEGDSVLIAHVDRDDKAPEVVDISTNDLSEKFAFTSKRARQKIFAGHEIASELFNIKFDDSFFSASSDLLTLQELFVKGYVEPRQNDLLEFLSYLSFIKTGEYLQMMFEPISLIGADLSNDVDLTQDERRKLKGYEPLKPVATDVNGKPIPVEATEVNDALVGLSATERNDINRIVHHFKTKKNGTSEALAIASLGAYGFSVSDAKKFLGINDGQPVTKMSSQVDKVLMAFANCGTEDNDDEILEVKAAHIHNSNDALKLERQIMKFADALIVSAKQLDSAILNALKGNPILTIDDLASQLQQDSLKISEAIARLTKKGFLVNDITGFKPTEKAIDKPTEPITSTEIYTAYKYALNLEKPSLKKGGTSRPFCKEMLAMSKTKSWSFEDIDNMTNDLGTNVWDYRGGYYTNPNTGEVDPDCRHLFNAIIKRRTIKK